MKLVMIFWLFFITGGCSGDQGLYAVVSSAEDESVVLKEERVLPGDLITLRWIHSVEKTPWLERYEVRDSGELVLVETEFESFGAGVDYSRGEMTVEDGKVKVTDLEQHVPFISWIHSEQASYTITINETQAAGPEDLPHHEAIMVTVEKR
ncbi:DUF1850 domain-containing protein [Alteribacter natronophilus]|uniref:DUF1850 domain-containing protein n=1 Tax=Alteribacter natronophilus TaxID=2583810 RepID=UPI00110DF81E|nr:DUF1850 domain-containing protein [Alteribacter natronophilus]TMW69992.1 DUF1850 domain-containing protein [Alteribacter natronophilus]